LWTLQRRAIYCQHQLAYLSTMGGAYHVCQNPDVALRLALRTEAIGRYLGANSVIVRARVHQAFNLAALGKTLMALRHLSLTKDFAATSEDASLMTIVEIGVDWLLRNSNTNSISIVDGQSQTKKTP
jgi:hypothetical protein